MDGKSRPLGFRLELGEFPVGIQLCITVMNIIIDEWSAFRTYRPEPGGDEMHETRVEASPNKRSESPLIGEE